MYSRPANAPREAIRARVPIATTWGTGARATVHDRRPAVGVEDTHRALLDAGAARRAQHRVPLEHGRVVNHLGAERNRSELDPRAPLSPLDRDPGAVPERRPPAWIDSVGCADAHP